jgi:hypothetical protein
MADGPDVGAGAAPHAKEVGVGPAGDGGPRWVTPRSSAASACFNPRAVISFCRFAISSARTLRYSASSREKPRSRKTFRFNGFFVGRCLDNMPDSASMRVGAK